MPLIFVYGSLKRGKKLHYLLKDALFLGSATTLKRHPLIISKSGWYPYMLKNGGGYRVKGEVYKISFNLLKKLDRVEEVPHYYVRKRVRVKMDGKSLIVWCYFFKKSKSFLPKECLKEFV